MTDRIINKIAKSGIISLDLTDYAPDFIILELDIKQFLLNGLILKEKDFRASLKKFNFKQYQNKVTAIFCSSDCIIPMWAFMLVTAYLNNIASEIYFGERNNVFQQCFLNNINAIEAKKFKNKKVIVKGCGQIPVSESIYIAITKKLNGPVSSLMFGEACSAVPVYKKKI